MPSSNPSPRKLCRACGERKPFDDFYVRRIAKSGIPTLQGACKKCENAQRSAWAKRNREKLNARQRARKRRLREKRSEAYFIILEQNRQSANRRRRRAGAPEQPWKARKGKRAAGGQLVPAAPFAEWAATILEREGCSVAVLALRFGMDAEQLRRYLNGTRTQITTAVIERAVKGEGGMDPDLYDDVKAGR